MILTGTEWEMVVYAVETLGASDDAEADFCEALAAKLGEANFNGEVEIVDLSADQKGKQ